MDNSSPEALNIRVGILVLNYHHPEETLACIRRLLEVEGARTRVIWIENDASSTESQAVALLETSGLPWTRLDPLRDPLPPPSCIGFIPVPENLGFAGGNNVGIRFLHRHGVEFAWVLNNDTLLLQGSSADLAEAARSNPDVGLWGMGIVHGQEAPIYGGLVQLRDFAVRHTQDPRDVATDPLAFVSGCSMFFRTELAASIACIPEDYFLYYEDLAFSWELRKRGHGFAALESVQVQHEGSLSTGHRSPLMEFYNRRNRWRFIQGYFPQFLHRQERRFVLYQLQKLLFRLRFDRIRLEWLAYRDFKAGRLGRTHRAFRLS